MTPTGNVGWFPRYSPDGSRLTWERLDYWQAQWFDNDTEIAQDDHHLIIGGVVTDLASALEIAAGGGISAVCRPNPIRVDVSTGQSFLGAGAPVVNPDRKCGYVDARQADAKNLIFDGKTIARGSITEPRASRQALVWSSAKRTWGMRLDVSDLPADITAAPVEFRPIPIDTPSGPWVLSLTHTGIVVRPFAETRGYRFDNGGQTYYPDAKYENDTIVAIFTNDRGEQFTETFDLSAQRVELGAPVPPVDFPPTFPTEPPVAYTPQAPDITDLIAQTTRDHPVEWAEAYEYDGHPRTDRFVRLVAARAHARDPRFGLNGKRGGDVLSLDVLAFKNPTVPDICGGVELRDFIFDDGRPGAGRHEVVWADATIVPGMRPDLPNGVPGKWIQPGSVTAPPGPTDPPPSADLLARVAALERGRVEDRQATKDALQAVSDALQREIDAINPAGDPTALKAAVEAILSGYEVNGRTAQTAFHQHTVKLSLTRRT